MLRKITTAHRMPDSVTVGTLVRRVAGRRVEVLVVPDTESMSDAETEFFADSTHERLVRAEYRYSNLNRCFATLKKRITPQVWFLYEGGGEV